VIGREPVFLSWRGAQLKNTGTLPFR